jgi:predicted AAA+ superfamily ATPase
MTGYLPRELHEALRRALSSLPVVVVTGMRQTGKTTFLQNDPLLKGHAYTSLDDFAALSAARSQPEALLAAHERVCIDEAQKAPELLVAVKRFVDRSRRPGRIVLSGSANFSLLKGVSESLAGRAVYLPLQPFSRREIQRKTQETPFLVHLLLHRSKPMIHEAAVIQPGEILLGGMPALHTTPGIDPSVWLRSFEQTYIERDIRDLARVEDLLGFRNLVKLVALRSGQVANLSSLARDVRLSLPTATRYLQLAEASFLLRRLPPFLRNRASRLIKSPKLYLTDSGLAGHLAGVDSLEAQEDEPLRGAMFETFVLQNLSATLETYLPEASIMF